MHSFSTTHRLNHSVANMFALVADVERYPEFVPLCEALHIRTRERLDDGREVLVADMTAAYKMFHETFTSRVTLDLEGQNVLVEYVDGPFRHLENRWQFTELGPGACEIEFYVAYEFASRSMQMLTGALFDRAFRKFVDAFEHRADAVYGAPPRGPVSGEKVT